ncbi:MAG: transposase [Terracidiphilus sp.]
MFPVVINERMFSKREGIFVYGLAPRRGLARHLYEEALNRMQERMTSSAMRLRRCTVEHPFATIKYRIFGHPRLLMRGLSGAKVEIGFATMAYNLKRITNVLGAAKLTGHLTRPDRTGQNLRFEPPSVQSVIYQPPSTVS